MFNSKYDDCFQDGFDDAERGKRFRGEMYSINWGRQAAEAYVAGWAEGTKTLNRKIAAANGYTLEELKGH